MPSPCTSRKDGPDSRAASAAVDGASPPDGQDLATGSKQLSSACPPQEQQSPPQRGTGVESHPETVVPVPKAFADARLLKLRRLAATRRHADEAEDDREEGPTDRLRDGQVDERPSSAAEGPCPEEDRLGSRRPVTELEGSCGGNESMFSMQRSHPAPISRPVAIPAASLFCSPPKPSGLLSSGMVPPLPLAPGFPVSRPAALPSSLGNSRLASPTRQPYPLSSIPPQARSPLRSAHLSPTRPSRSSSISSAEAGLAQGPSAPLTIPSQSDPSTSVTRLQRRRSSAAYGSSSSVSPGRKPFLTPPGSSYGSLVGSFEESIISGRMSTVPSKPITFVAQIGVVGIGKCRPSLRCPPHITIEFPAYFYELADDESPTPYVGTIDVDGYGYAKGYDYHYGGRQASPSSTGEAVESRKRKWYGYRVPPKGQVQVVVKNPNKTAVKVFLCPYDLTDMPPETKTFLKQKTYHDPTPPASAASSPSVLESRSLSPAFGLGQAGCPEPVVDGCSPFPAQQQQRTALGSPRPPTRSTVRLHKRKRPALRYAIHMQFLCPKRGKIYLHRGIRVVFSHRAPDGSEYLRVVNDVPNPKYTSLASPPRGRPDRERERERERKDLPREEVDDGQAECAGGGPPSRNASPDGTMEIDTVVDRSGGRGRSGHPGDPAPVDAEPARAAAVAVAGAVDGNGNRCAARDSLSCLAMGLSAADRSEASDSPDGRHASFVSAPGSMPPPVPSVIGADENRTR